jgi:uncharacterized membrane protein YccC
VKLVYFWRTIVSFQPEKIVPWIGARNAIGVGSPLAVCAALGAISSGLALGTGALNVAFSDSAGPYLQRVRRMLSASALVGGAVFAGGLAAQDERIALGLAFAWAFASGMLVSLSPIAADLGTVSLVTMLVYSASPLDVPHAALAGLLAFGGGLFQTAISLLLWPIRPYAPERRVLAELYLELSRAAASAINVYQPPPATAQSTAARESLESLDRDHSVEAARYRLLLSEAEQLRLGVLLLARLRRRIRRAHAAGAEGDILDRVLEHCSRVLRTIGDALTSTKPATQFSDYLQALDGLAGKLRTLSSAGSAPDEHSLAALITDARSQVDAVVNRLCAAADLVTASTPEGAEAFERRQTRRPWKLRIEGTLALLRSNLTVHSAACRHAVRLAAGVIVGDALARGLHMQRSYWLPMTVAIVLKPDFTGTFSRGVSRLVGTFCGLGLATALIHLLPETAAVQVTLVTIFMFLLRGFGPANYGIFVIAVTALVVFLFSMTGVEPNEVISARALNTAAGGAIALLLYWLWPTWERTQVPEALARTLDALRHYFRVLRESYENQERSLAHELDRARMAGRLARTNVEASVERMGSEPGCPPESLRSVSAAMAALFRLAHALMALEAGFAASRPVPPRRAFYRFANEVELTMYYLASSLRGSSIDRTMLPNLREALHALVHSPEALTERYALVNVEADRITSSLDMLAEELLKWRAAGVYGKAISRKAIGVVEGSNGRKDRLKTYVRRFGHFVRQFRT